jgi:adenosine deaminase
LLHTHLEGSIPSKVLKDLSKRNNIKLSFDPFAGNIYKSIEAHNWGTFRKIYYEMCSCLISADDFYYALYYYGIKLAKENIVYAEIQFSPWKHLSRGISFNIIEKGLIEAIIKLKKDYNIIIKLICDLIRKKEEKCAMILDWLIDMPRDYFVALGISGGIDSVERIHYRKYCAKAKANNLFITAHAGEIEGAESVIEVVEYLMADRIGHGIRSIENSLLLDALITNNIHLEICPTANKVIGLCKNNYDPIKTIISKGINFSINTDDEFIFNTNLYKEIEILILEGIISDSNILELQYNALVNSFAEKETKKKLLRTYYK